MGEEKKSKVSGSLAQDMEYLNRELGAGRNFDMIYRVIHVGGKEACMYLVDGFCKDDLVQKLLQYLMDVTPDKMPQDMHGISKQFIPYVEVEVDDGFDTIIHSLLSGMFILLIDGFNKALLID